MIKVHALEIIIIMQKIVMIIAHSQKTNTIIKIMLIIKINKNEKTTIPMLFEDNNTTRHNNTLLKNAADSDRFCI